MFWEEGGGEEWVAERATISVTSPIIVVINVPTTKPLAAEAKGVCFVDWKLNNEKQCL